MQVARYIRAYHKQTGTVAFKIELPSDCLTFLSMVDFLIDGNENDPLLYCCYELTKEQCDYLLGSFHFFIQADTDYFDYFLECDSIPIATNKVKTRQELLDHLKTDEVFSTIVDLFHFQHRSLSEKHKDMCYKIYLQGITDGKI